MPHTNVPLARTDWKRAYGGYAELPLRNRFFENDPTSTEDPTALLARPGTDFYRVFGTFPIRALFSQPGFFGGNLFVVADQTLYRWDGTTLITITGVLSDSPNPVSITYQASPGVERLWLADGTTLWYYEGSARASGSLTFTAQPADGDTVVIDGIYYRFSSANVDSGSPAGTMANPWRVLIGVTLAGSIDNLGAAIDNSGTPGGQYSSALTANANVQTRRVEPERLQVQARVAGAAGNSITTTETGANMAWANGTLQNGGTHTIIPITVPEGATDPQAAVSVTALASYVIISVAGSQRLFFIRPAEFWVEIFAEAESEPDVVLQVVTVGGVFWALGQSTIEPWAPTGDADIPFAPIQGRQLRYGIISGTAQVIDDTIIYVDENGIVRDESGQRLSTNGIEEQIRLRG